MAVTTTSPRPRPLDPALVDRELEQVDSFWSSAWRQFRRNKLAVVSAWFIITLAIVAVVVPFLLPQTYADQDISVSLQGPS